MILPKPSTVVLGGLCAVALGVAAITVRVTGQSANQAGVRGAHDTDWPYYGGDDRNWRYKPFDQITAA